MLLYRFHHRPRGLFHLVMIALLIMLGACVKPPSIDKLMSDARHFQEQGNSKAAAIQLSNVLQRDPKHAEARFLLGTIYLKKGSTLRAENQLREALREAE